MYSTIFLIIGITFSRYTNLIEGSAGCDYTYSHHTGNRVVEGKGTFPASLTFDLHHPGVKHGGKYVSPIQWVMGRQGTNGTVHWFATDMNGRIWVFEHRPGLQPVFRTVMESPMVPFLTDFPFLLPDDSSFLTHPVCLPDDHLLYISAVGDIVLINKLGRELARAPSNALLDGRLVLNSNRSMVAFYTAASKPSGYVHGVLGDTIEGGSLVILDTKTLKPVREIRLTDKQVIFEGLSPMWADFDDDGSEEIVATLSDNKRGAAIYLFNTRGDVVARSESIGQGSRWRHQLAVAKLGPNKENEIVDVHTPHLGQMVEFFVKDEDKLRLVASRHGYTSHVIGSRNLDMAVAGDFDGDGKPELVVPSASRYRIVGIRRTDHGFQRGYVDELWEFWLGKRLTSNIAAVKLWGNKLALGVGLEDGTLRIFLPNNLF